MNSIEETTLIIDFDKLKSNYEFIKSKVKPSTKIMAVVKAFAYGSDAEAVANYLQSLQVDYFAVAYTHEGIALRQAGIAIPILVLHPQPINFTDIFKYDLEPSIYSKRTLTAFVQHLPKAMAKECPIHLKFNTGLNRLGFNYEDLEFITNLVNHKPITVASIFSHLAASEDHNERTFTRQQIAQFKAIKTQFEKLCEQRPMYHILNTSGILNYSEQQFDMVRTGIGLYGFGNDPKFDAELQPIAALKSVISQIHNIQPNESVGYNRAFTATATTKTATIPIGHADGIGRQYGNRTGFVTLDGQRAYIIGNVCMDMIMIDITNIDCEEGDEVIIFDGNHTAQDLAATANTISYEVITAVSQRIKRQFRR